MKPKNRFALVFPLAIVLLLLGSARLAAPVRAQGGEWEETTLPGGYFLQEIQFFNDENGRAYGWKQDENDISPFLYETTDGGVTWTEQEAVMQKLKNWSDTISFSGQGFTVTSACKVSRLNELFFVSPQQIYADAVINCHLGVGGAGRDSDRYAILRTGDGGQTWSQTNMADADGRPTKVVSSPDGSVWMILYENATMIQRVVFSADGVKFTPRSIADLPDAAITDLSFPNTAFGYVEASIRSNGKITPVVMLTLDGGETWSKLSMPSGLEFDELSDFYFLDENTGWAVGHASRMRSEGMEVQDGAILRTTDGGNTWQETIVLGFADDPPYAYLALREVNFQNPSIGFAIGRYEENNGVDGPVNSQDILYGSADGGTTWEPVLHAPSIGTTWEPVPHAPSIGCLVATDSYVYVCSSAEPVPGNPTLPPSILRMELPAPRPTPTPTSIPTLTPVPLTRTPIPSPTPTPDSGIACPGASVILVLTIFLWRFLGKK